MKNENILAVFVGVLVFLGAFLIEERVLNSRDRGEKMGKAQYINRRSGYLYIMGTFVFSVLTYYFICVAAGVHHKLCCSFKAWVITLVLHAVYRQFFVIED